MISLNQLISQTRQLLLFHNMVPLPKLLGSIASFPFEYFGSSGKAGFPLAINMLISSRCNLHCEICHFESPKFCAENEELSVKEIKSFVEREAKRKPHIFLGGGEPFFREDIFEIIETIKMAGLTYGICTNGTLLDQNKVRELIRLNPLFIIFSLHGTREIHDRVTGTAGSFERLLRSVQALSALGNRARIIINCVITQSNLNQLREIVKIAENLRVDLLRFVHLNYLTPQELIKHNSVCKKEFPDEEITLSLHSENCAANWYDYYQRITEIVKERKEFKVPIFFKPFLNQPEIKSWYSNDLSPNRKCMFVWKSLFISPSGDILPCQFLLYKLGNIKTDSLESVWNSLRYRKLRLKLKKKLLPGCARCCKL